MLTFRSVFLHSTQTEPGRYLFTVAGNIDSDEILSSHERLHDMLRTLSERSDLRFGEGELVYTTDYRQVHLWLRES